MATNVVSNNLVSASYANVEEIIKSDISDPATGGANSEKRKWVYTRDPDTKSINFQGYPFIVINSPVITPGPGQTGDGSIQTISWVIEVEVVTSDRGWNDQDGKGFVQNNTISDSMFAAFNGADNRKTLRNNGMKRSKPESTGMIPEPLTDTLVFRNSFMLRFSGKKKVF